MTRKELEAENRVMKRELHRLRREAARAHGPFGRSWVDGFAAQALRDAEVARQEAEAKVVPVSAEERRARAYSNFL